MMSHYGLPYEYEDHWICGALELSIETLAGTAFEIKVSPNDTIMSIKSKIQSVEGIPVSQQHLLYNLEELDNSASVRDYSIQNGATLKLVLSMRGGPISTKIDEMAWRELQALMSITRKDDLFERLPSGSRVTVLVFRDADQVNLLRVVENEDGSFSPLSESWNGTSIRNLFAEEDPEEYGKRLQENSVTMGKMQELKEKLGTLSIQRKGMKADSSPKINTKILRDGEKEEISRRHAFVNFPSGDYSHTNSIKLIRRPDQELEEPGHFRPRGRLVSCSKASMTALTKARKEAENIIRMQSNLSVLVDSEPSKEFGLRRTPLPEIRRSPRPDKSEKKSEEKEIRKNLREKTAKSFAISEEENDLTTASSICSSQSSIFAMPLNEKIAIAHSPISREGMSTSFGRNNKFRVSRHVLDNDERPKTTPGKLDNNRDVTCNGNRQVSNVASESENRKRPTYILSTFSNVLSRVSSKSQVDLCNYEDKDKKSELPRNQPKKLASTLSRNPSIREETLISPSAQKLSPSVKKRLRCSQCKKKLNITNTYTCRCGLMFCAVHRYSEVHNCPFDYKAEGRKILQQMNPLVAASKLPKI